MDNWTGGNQPSNFAILWLFRSFQTQFSRSRGRRARSALSTLETESNQWQYRSVVMKHNSLAVDAPMQRESGA